MHFVIQKQKHTNKINTVGSRTQSWEIGDAMISYESEIALIVYGADCSIISFSNNEMIGACHAGWRGFSSGIIKEMASRFSGGACYVAPFLHRFEVKKDDCYRKIENYCGDKYFYEENGIIIFDFKSAVTNELIGIDSFVDERSTADDIRIASWRRDHLRGDGTQNRLAIWRHEDREVVSRFFLPKQDVKAYVISSGF